MRSRFTDFAGKVVAWQAEHGRHELPWQNTRDPYKVWLSEIMLQQTQVSTVKSYFIQFLARYPTVFALAAASLDDVLGIWSGLGYYSRARNLHRCACTIVTQYAGQFPGDAKTLATLPGIGRSTAAAIASLCFGERVAILDANAKRVVARVHAFALDLARPAHERDLWQLATELLPAQGVALSDMARYTQGMMDLGAQLCSPKKPDCRRCPVQSMCLACLEGDPQRYPVRTKTLKRSSASLWMLHVQCADASVWLSKRPTQGVWGGLHCLPMFESEEAMCAALPAALCKNLARQAPFVHQLTHKDLHLHPWRLQLESPSLPWTHGRWVAACDWPALGLPAPVRKLLEQAR